MSEKASSSDTVLPTVRARRQPKAALRPGAVSSAIAPPPQTGDPARVGRAGHVEHVLDRERHARERAIHRGGRAGGARGRGVERQEGVGGGHGRAGRSTRPQGRGNAAPAPPPAAAARGTPKAHDGPLATRPPPRTDPSPHGPIPPHGPLPSRTTYDEPPIIAPPSRAHPPRGGGRERPARGGRECGLCPPRRWVRPRARDRLGWGAEVALAVLPTVTRARRAVADRVLRRPGRSCSPRSPRPPSSSTATRPTA